MSLVVVGNVIVHIQFNNMGSRMFFNLFSLLYLLYVPRFLIFIRSRYYFIIKQSSVSFIDRRNIIFVLFIFIWISYIITDRHSNPLFSVSIVSPNPERKIMQTNCVRKTGAVFFGGREIIRGNLTLCLIDTQHY